MYLHIGDNVSIPEKDIIGIFDIDKTTTTGETRSFLSHSEQSGTSITISEEMPKSFIVVSDQNSRKKQKIYISPISASTLKERSRKGLIDKTKE
ncbi:MAG: extracellular matrix regulator RemB [Clostridia bacterium]